MSTNSGTETASPTTEHELTSKQLRRMRQTGWRFTFLALFGVGMAAILLLNSLRDGAITRDGFFRHTLNYLLLSLFFFAAAYSKFNPSHKTEWVKMIMYMASGAVVMNCVREFTM